MTATKGIPSVILEHGSAQIIRAWAKSISHLETLN